MNLSRPFIARPVATTVIMLALVIFGWFAYRALPVSELPNIDFPTIVVTASLPGADPETMASTVATPLEKQFSTIASIDSMSSTSSAGQTRITIQFTLDRNIDAAAQDVQSAISAVIKQLPPQMPSPPSLRKVNPALAPVLFLALTADHLPLSKLDDYAETYIAQNLSMVPGVAEVNVYGSQQYAVRILLNPNALATRNLSVEGVISAIQNLNVNLPSGTLQTEANYHLIKVDGQLNDAKAFNEGIVAVQNGGVVRIKDIGTAIDSVANDKIATWYNDKRSIVLSIQRQAGSNTVEVVDGIYKILPDLLKKIPGEVKLQVLYDRSVFIKDSVQDVEYTLIFAVFLVLMITYLFFKNFGSTLITALDFPTSLVATFGVMYLLNYSLDNLSLMGLVLAVGFVIDDTIVVLENILRHMEAGSPRYKAALEATAEISFTVLSMTLSLAAVFIPILFMGGLIGRLFHEFAVVVGSAILFSGFVSLTLTPMLRSRFLAIGSQGPSNIVVEKFSTEFEKTKDFYIKTLNWSLKNNKIIGWGAAVILILMIWLFYVIPKGFIPSEDTGLIIGTTQVQEGLSFEEFISRQQAVAARVAENPNVESTISTVGQATGGVLSSNNGQLIIRLKPRSNRHLSSDEIIQTLRRPLNEVPGIKVYLQNPPAIRIGAFGATGNLQYVLHGSIIGF